MTRRSNHPVRGTVRLLLAALGALGALLLGGATLAGCGAAIQGPIVTTIATSPWAPTPAVSSPSPATTPPATTTHVVALTSTLALPPPAPTTTPVPARRTTTDAPSQNNLIGEHPSCGVDEHRNVEGTCVNWPEHGPAAPFGVIARCVDGTYSFSQPWQGTCSRHGGVAQWF